MSKLSLGNYGEDLACTYLRNHGYKILQRNFRLRGGEIDIIARKHDTVVFIEVKTRISEQYGLPEDAISPYKLFHLRKACEYFIATQNVKNVSYRLDAIVIALDSLRNVLRIEQIENILQ